MNEEDAIRLIIESFLNDRVRRLQNYGYDIYIPNLIRDYIGEIQPRLDHNQAERQLSELFPVFTSAAWSLCRRGILRPGIRSYRAQATDEGSAGCGFSLTPFGIAWLQDTEHHLYVPTEPGRFAELLQPYRVRFGPGFHQRAQAAVSCYGANIYLACCAMCGAAAESILLATAIAREGEVSVLRTYASSRGRLRVEQMVTSRIVEPLRLDFTSHTRLINYWRDESAHGRASNISENEAFTSLALMLRFALFVDSNWGVLTT